jgi:hypothetical protein
MLRRLLGTGLLLGWMAITLGCGSGVENKPNLKPATPPPAKAEGGGPPTSTATPGG